jgi:ActR/RegA family two-component response regulator
VSDDEAVRDKMNQTLTSKGCEVAAARSVIEALKHIAEETFDVLITDLELPDPGDDFTVISAMRHSQPQALTLLISGYPDVFGGTAAILLEADEVLVKPFEVAQMAELIDEKMLNRKLAKRTMVFESVAAILARCSDSIVTSWLQEAKRNRQLNSPSLSDSERVGHLGKLVQDLVRRLNSGVTQSARYLTVSNSAIAHGKLRCQQGYTPEMLVHESRILQGTIFGTLNNNMTSLDFRVLLPDVMLIADEVDAQLTEAMGSFMKLKNARFAESVRGGTGPVS